MGLKGRNLQIIRTGPPDGAEWSVQRPDLDLKTRGVEISRAQGKVSMPNLHVLWSRWPLPLALILSFSNLIPLKSPCLWCPGDGSEPEAVTMGLGERQSPPVWLLCYGNL